MSLRACSIVLVSLWSGAARAEIAYAESLDWLTVDADVVARGRVVRWADTGEVVLRDVVALRGRAERELTVEIPARGCLPVALVPGEHVLVFLRDGSPRCGVDRAWSWAISLDDPERAYTLTGAALATGERVLAHVEAASRRAVSRAVNPAATRDERFLLHQGPMRVDVSGTPAGAELYAGSAVHLGVPPYEDLRDELLERSRSPDAHQREVAARQLANYPGPEVELRLRELLRDEAVAEHVSGGVVVARSWPVREAAWDSLKAHGVLADPSER